MKTLFFALAMLASAQTVQFYDQETPAGAMDGTNAVFTLAAAPNPASSLILTLNGLVQKVGADFTLASQTITTAAPLNPGDILLAWYRSQEPPSSSFVLTLNGLTQPVTATGPNLMTVGATTYILPYMVTATPFSSAGFKVLNGTPTVIPSGNATILGIAGTAQAVYGHAIGASTSLAMVFDIDVVGSANSDPVWADGGLYLYESSSGKGLFCALEALTPGGMPVTLYCRAQAAFAALTPPQTPILVPLDQTQGNAPTAPYAMRAMLSGGTVSFALSMNGGRSWADAFYSVPSTTFFTAAPDTWGPFISQFVTAGSTTTNVTILSYGVGP